MRHFSLRQLRVFESVSRHLSFTRAAEEMHLTQPAVSMQVRQLQDSVGLPLFEQVGRRILLTDAGIEVQKLARGIARQMADTETAVDEIKGLKRGHLKITVAATANYFVPPLLADFNKRFPGITVSLDVTNREGLLRQLDENDTDIAIMGRPPNDRDYDFQTFRDNPLVIIARPDHPLARKRRIPLERLADETFLVREPGSGTRIAMERFFHERNMRVRTGMEVGSNEAIKQCVQAGLGLGLLSQDTVRLELKLKQLAVLDVEDFPIMRHWYAVTMRNRQPSRTTQAFREFLLSQSQTKKR
jgi:DNA-binding transcriptional LysR family regulator